MLTAFAYPPSSARSDFFDSVALSAER